MEKTGERYSIARLHVVGVSVARAGGNGANRPDGFAAATASADQPGAASVPAICQLKITIADIEPAIWRRLHVPADATLAELHEAIQAAFGWLNYHLHQYIVDGQHIGVPSPEYSDELPPMNDEQDVRVRDIVGATKIIYEYDFGDSWEHVIEIESVATAGGPDVICATCSAGARARPPEDCGGTSGYQRLLEILADREHQDYRQMKTWVGRRYDPEKLDLAAVNRALQRLRRRSSSTRSASRSTRRPASESR
jgi:hypothetical protein